MKESIVNFKSRIQLWLVSLVMLLFISCGGASIPGLSISHTLYSLNDLILQDITADSVTLSWDMYSGEGGVMDRGIKYYVTVKNASNTIVANTIYSTGDDFIQNTRTLQLNPDRTKAVDVVLTGLNRGEVYTIKVAARNYISDMEIQSASMKVIPTEDTIYTWPYPLNGFQTNNNQLLVKWNEMNNAHFYVIAVVEDKGNLFGVVRTEKHFKVVCPPAMSTFCSEGNVASTNKNNGSELSYLVKGLTVGKKYNLIVVPTTFKELVGLKFVDKDGNAVIYEDSVKKLIENELIEMVGTTERRQTDVILQKSRIRDKVENFLGGGSTIQQVEMKQKSAGGVSGVVTKSSDNMIYLSWNHAPGANGYGLILKTNGVQVRSNFISDRHASQYAGIGYHSFTALTPNTRYGGVIVSFLDNVAGGSNTFTATTTTNSISSASAIADFTLTNSGAGIMDVSWTNRGDSILAYNVYYHKGASIPNSQKPKYIANPNNNERSVRFNVDSGEYSVRVDIVDAFGIHMGSTKKVKVYSYPVVPKDLALDYLNGFRYASSPGYNLDSKQKLYKRIFPITYSELTTPSEAGGPVSDVSYYTRYKRAGSDWTSFRSNFSSGSESVYNGSISKYGQGVDVQLKVSNRGGYTATVSKRFMLKSFPFPVYNGLNINPGEKSLNISWPVPTQLNGSVLDHYSLMVFAQYSAKEMDRFYPTFVTNVLLSPNTTSFTVDGLVHNTTYRVWVLPVGKSTGSVLDEIKRLFKYNPLDRNTYSAKTDAAKFEFSTFTSINMLYKHIGWDTALLDGDPDPVTNLTARVSGSTVAVNWVSPAAGTTASEFLVENIALDITNATNFRGKTGTNTMTFADDYANLDYWTNANKQTVTNTNTLSLTGLDTANKLQIIRVKVKRLGVTQYKKFESDYVYYAIDIRGVTTALTGITNPKNSLDTIPSPSRSRIEKNSRSDNQPIPRTDDDG